MISTSLGYHLYGNNLQQSLLSTAAQPVVTQSQAYYNANIGKVKSVSDLVNNYKLLSYATQAFGLSDMTYAKALLTKVLTSDLTDPKSVANQLTDSRYVTFAKAFSFNTDGSIKTTAQLQTTAQQTSTEALFATNTTLNATDAATATKAYQAAIGSMTSLSQLESNPSTLGYVLTAYGIDPTTAASTFEQTLESNLSSPSSYVNSQTDNGYVALAQAVSVNADGTAISTVQAQTTTSVNATTDAYSIYTASGSTAQAAAATETSYYLSKIGTITTASALTSDPRLVSYLKQAFQLPSTATANDIQSALTSDTTNPSSFARSSPYPAFLALAKSFNFSTTGAAQNVTQFQTAAQQQSTTSLYTQRQTSDNVTAAAATAYYNANIGNVKSVTDLENNAKLLSYVETAYGINTGTPTATLNQIMENTNNFAQGTTNGTLLALKLGFNVDANGNGTNPLTSQSTNNMASTITAYLTNTASDTASQAAAKTATLYYQEAIKNVTSVSSLLADPKLVAYVEKAYSIPTNTTPTVLTQVFTSDLSNLKSKANALGSNYAAMASAFDFTTTGLVGTETQGAQTKAQLYTTNSGYIDQQMETDASAQNPGIGLALYLQFNASKITDAYSILADTKLTTILQTALGLSSTSSAGSIDSQAATINSKIKLSDLKDPTKLSAFIQKFSILYDLNPPTVATPSSPTSLITGSDTPLDPVAGLFGTSPNTALTTASLFGA